MGPYRERQPLRRPTHTVGSDRARRRKQLAGLGLVLLSVAMVAAWWAGGGRIVGTTLLPAIFGVGLLFQARSSSIELRPEERQAVAVVRRIGPPQRTRFAYADLIGASIVPVSFKSERVDYELRLGLGGDRSVALLRASSTADLLRPLAELDAFFAENGLPESPHVRLPTEPPPADEPLPANEQDARTLGPALRR